MGFTNPQTMSPFNYQIRIESCRPQPTNQNTTNYIIPQGLRLIGCMQDLIKEGLYNDDETELCSFPYTFIYTVTIQNLKYI